MLCISLTCFHFLLLSISRDLHGFVLQFFYFIFFTILVRLCVCVMPITHTSNCKNCWMKSTQNVHIESSIPKWWIKIYKILHVIWVMLKKRENYGKIKYRKQTKRTTECRRICRRKKLEMKNECIEKVSIIIIPCLFDLRTSSSNILFPACLRNVEWVRLACHLVCSCYFLLGDQILFMFLLFYI